MCPDTASPKVRMNLTKVKISSGEPIDAVSAVSLPSLGPLPAWPAHRRGNAGSGGIVVGHETVRMRAFGTWAEITGLVVPG